MYSYFNIHQLSQDIAEYFFENLLKQHASKPLKKIISKSCPQSKKIVSKVKLSVLNVKMSVLKVMSVSKVMSVLRKVKKLVSQVKMSVFKRSIAEIVYNVYK